MFNGLVVICLQLYWRLAVEITGRVVAEEEEEEEEGGGGGGGEGRDGFWLLRIWSFGLIDSISPGVEESYLTSGGTLGQIFRW